MVEQGLIDSRAFSLDLRDIDSPDGSIIFGGLDTGKYVGSLEKVPILDIADTPDKADRYWINLTAVGLTLPSGESGLVAAAEVPVYVDSGTSLTELPTNVFESIGAAFPGAVYIPGTGFYWVKCTVGGSVDFVFDNKVISVSYDDFIYWPSKVFGLCPLGVVDSGYGGLSSVFFLPPSCKAKLIIMSRWRGPGRYLPPRGVRGLRPGQSQHPPRTS